eukprot:CAMPEP_0174285558 /NCGR_PEP_ID=MMETSP0809-20121228/8938_1 /TAXON_ID=73025 ORGANISM="Eutreptiella gymnastica-like, Strain CCMP1594" /NCGR_SAMPLE_ID=MMETSP0809 /ASSEMBLY_ACC=CAM_ASM_000658 /LENGTH=328 /DNA_ID=CAMNT_0015381363 /DNA_START=60 /DNA_END=1043 /DNA_ORIENTATION=-
MTSGTDSVAISVADSYSHSHSRAVSKHVGCWAAVAALCATAAFLASYGSLTNATLLPVLTTSASPALAQVQGQGVHGAWDVPSNARRVRGGLSALAGPVGMSEARVVADLSDAGAAPPMRMQVTGWLVGLGAVVGAVVGWLYSKQEKRVAMAAMSGEMSTAARGSRLPLSLSAASNDGEPSPLRSFNEILDISGDGDSGASAPKRPSFGKGYGKGGGKGYGITDIGGGSGSPRGSFMDIKDIGPGSDRGSTGTPSRPAFGKGRSFGITDIGGSGDGERPSFATRKGGKGVFTPGIFSDLATDNSARSTADGQTSLRPAKGGMGSWKGG